MGDGVVFCGGASNRIQVHHATEPLLSSSGNANDRAWKGEEPREAHPARGIVFYLTR